MTAYILKLVSRLPSWVWASLSAVLLVASGWTAIELVLANSELDKSKLELSEYKYSLAESDRKALVRLLDRNIILSNDIALLQKTEAQNVKDLQYARNKLAKYSNGVQRGPTAAELERDFRATGYERASTYASGVEGIYRSCAKEYIDLGIGPGGAAEAAKAAHAQKGRADALEKALKPIPPIPPIK